MNVKHVLWGLLLLAWSAQAQVIKPAAGITPIKWGGINISLLHTQLDQNNAHTIEYMSFFVPTATGPATQLGFEIKYGYMNNLELNKGADCATSAARVWLVGEQLKVVYAVRKGEWFDKKNFDFTIFELVKEKSGAPGYPALYFKEIKKVTTAKKYCDANISLEKESNLYQ